MPDKYSATWVSHSSLSDYIKCPRAYYLKNVYKDPKTGHKIQITGPSLALGLAVHDVLDTISSLPTATRFDVPLPERFETSWKKVSGKLGGFSSPETEKMYKDRGAAMLERVAKHKGPLVNLTVKIKQDLPNYWLSEEENIILCGKVDWLEYLPDSDTVHIIDFKTSKREEDPNSLQLPIYHLLVANCQKRHAAKASYWYLELSDELSEKPLPDLEEAKETVLKLAKRVKLARKLGKFDCPKGGCFACTPFEKVLAGEGEFVGEDNFHRDIYMLNNDEPSSPDSELL
ncbi:MAG TPA: PD-(D/E)XK nuclease family protein [Patescibacteria group bacterium]|nr:PD-(D/E)XK nuclease family protein [Patescibacteria group bacterium]